MVVVVVVDLSGYHGDCSSDWCLMELLRPRDLLGDSDSSSRGVCLGEGNEEREGEEALAGSL